jgi:hypothetical protein
VVPDSRIEVQDRVLGGLMVVNMSVVWSASSCRVERGGVQGQRGEGGCLGLGGDGQVKKVDVPTSQ